MPDRDQPHIFGIHNEGSQSTQPSEYAFNILASVHQEMERLDVSPSTRVVRALQKANSRVRTTGFRRAVLDAIFAETCTEHYESESRFTRVLRRAEQRFGKTKARQLLVARIEILDSWKNRDASMVPDAYLLDAERQTIVCYEVEDTHPLNPRSIGAYANAWYTLEYIYWDLHLIAYDVYGHHKIIVFPHAELVARHMRMRKSARARSEA